MESTVRPLTQRLREDTRGLHAEAEGAPLEQHLAKGTLPKEAYIRYIEQRYILHRHLEARIREHHLKVKGFAKIIADFQFQEPYALEDLLYFGKKPESAQPLRETEEFLDVIDTISRDNPVGLLGVHYVFEGSNNGGRFLAKGVRHAYRLEGSHGTKYLDPYGEAQRAHWAAFKEDMDAVDYTEAEMDAIVAAAGETFRGITRIDRALYPG